MGTKINAQNYASGRYLHCLADLQHILCYIFKTTSSSSRKSAHTLSFKLNSAWRFLICPFKNSCLPRDVEHSLDLQTISYQCGWRWRWKRTITSGIQFSGPCVGSSFGDRFWVPSFGYSCGSSFGIQFWGPVFEQIWHPKVLILGSSFGSIFGVHFWGPELGSSYIMNRGPFLGPISGTQKQGQIWPQKLHKNANLGPNLAFKIGV